MKVIMNKKLTWKEIELGFDKQWIQLTDYDWPEEEALPFSGVVVAHAKSRKEFDELITKNFHDYSALLYVGERDLPPNTFLSANMHQWKNI
jgi:hypothetical protein